MLVPQGVHIEMAYLEFVNLQRMVGQGERVFGGAEPAG
jgi:hypothetical protein